MSTYNVTVNGRTFDVRLIEKRGTAVRFAVGSKEYSVDVAYTARPTPASGSGHQLQPTVQAPRPTAKVSSANEVIAPMPGIVVSVKPKAGEIVKLGDTVAVIEAMKMENNITSPRSGTILEVLVNAGQEVGNGQALVRFAPEA